MLCLVWFITIILDIIHKNRAWRIVGLNIFLLVYWNRMNYFEQFWSRTLLILILIISAPSPVWRPPAFLTDWWIIQCSPLIGQKPTEYWPLIGPGSDTAALSAGIIDPKHKQHVILSVLFPPDNWCLKISWAEIIPWDWWRVCLKIEACSLWSH